MKKKTVMKIVLLAGLIVAIFAVMFIVSGSLTDNAGAAEAGTHYLGDVDNDDYVTAADARLALRAAVKLEDYAPGSLPFLCADYNGDGDISAGDARMILRTAVNLEPLILMDGTLAEEENEARLRAEEEAKNKDREKEPSQSATEPAPVEQEPVYQGDGINTCMYCGKPCASDTFGNYACAFGGCTRSSFSDFTCIHCGATVPANTCHTCANPTYIITTEPEK